MHHEMTPAGQAHRVATRGSIERLGHRRTPVDHHGFAVLVCNRQATDMEALDGLRSLGMPLDTAEHQRGITQIQLNQAVQQGLVEHIALVAGLKGSPESGLTQFSKLPRIQSRALEACVGVVDEGLLVCEVWVMLRHPVHAAVCRLQNGSGARPTAESYYRRVWGSNALDHCRVSVSRVLIPGMKSRVALAGILTMGATVGGCRGGHTPEESFDDTNGSSTPIVWSPASTGSTPPLSDEVVWTLHDRLIACLVQPETCELATIAARDSAAYDELTALIAERRSQGLEARPPLLPPTRRILRSWSADTSGSVEWCWVDDLVLTDTDSVPGQAVVLDESEHTLAESWTLQLIEGAWRVADRNITHLAHGRSTWCS